MSMKFILISSFYVYKTWNVFFKPMNSFPSFSGHLFICLSYRYSPKDTYGILIKILMYYKGFWYYTVCQTAFSYENCMHHKFYQICIKWHPLFNSCTCFWDQQLLHNFPKSDNKVSSLQNMSSVSPDNTKTASVWNQLLLHAGFSPVQLGKTQTTENLHNSTKRLHETNEVSPSN